jgi:hypothetical protein
MCVVFPFVMLIIFIYFFCFTNEKGVIVRKCSAQQASALPLQSSVSCRHSRTRFSCMSTPLEADRLIGSEFLEEGLRSQPPPLAPTTRGTIFVALILVLPFAGSKMAIAAYTAYQELLFGNTIGGAALAGEADAYHVLFLFMGTAMGGLRATSILAAPSFQEVPSRLRKLAAGDLTEMLCKSSHVATVGVLQRIGFLVAALMRGMPSPKHHNMSIDIKDKCDQSPVEASNINTLVDAHHHRGGSDEDHVGDANALVVVASSFVILYSVGSALLIKFASAHVIHGIAPWTTHPVLQVVASFGDGFWWGSLPTLLLYNKEQLLLASGHSLLPLIYGGVVYCGVGAYMAKCWVGSTEIYVNAEDNVVNNGVRQIGLSLAASAAVGYVALKIHLWVDPRTRAHNHPSLCAGLALWRCYQQVNRSVLSVVHDKLLPTFKVFLFLAIPLAVSNSLGLIRQLIITATTSECNSDAAQAYSISQAYYSTAEIALLAASSTISAIVAVDRTFENAAIVVVIGFSLVLGVLPLLIPTEIAEFFGGSVYSYGKAEVDDVIHDVRYFNILSTVAFCLVAASMSIAATLHGRRIVWRPLLIQLVSNALGVAWAVVLWTEHSSIGVDCVWQSGGSVVTAVVSTGALIVLRHKTVQ